MKKMRCSSSFSLLLFLLVMNFSSVESDYRWSRCNNGSKYTDGSAYSDSLSRVMSDLLRNAPDSSGFSTSSFGEMPNKVYGLLQCIGNVSPRKCSDCAQQASNSVKEVCPTDIGGLVLMDDCFLRYDNYDFISTLDDKVYIILYNRNNISGNVDDFKATTSSLLSNLLNLAYDPGNKLYAIGSAKYSTSQNVYGLAQCWRHLSIEDCRTCLVTAGKDVEVCCSVKQGAQALLGSCTVRFDITPFSDTALASPSTPTIPAPPTKDKPSKTSLIIGCVVGALIVASILIIVAMRCNFGRPGAQATHKKGRHEYKTGSARKSDTQATHNKGSQRQHTQATHNKATTSESRIRKQQQNFEIMTLEALNEATQKFHESNFLGKGGFGPVYKGRKKDGKEIAVKKLSSESSQGGREFMNEVEMMAKVQHKNVVKLLGCCFEGKEKLLVYEYFPNKSLDTYLFCPEKCKELDWQKRYGIINGIANGLLYLNRDLQPRIIHRDIKPNNILLDDKLHPKIGDFGLARFFPEYNTHIQTSKLAGTLGYMAPEFREQGRLSDKTDVYSFGVVVLEIVSGMRIMDQRIPHKRKNLVEWARTLKKAGNVINMVDSTVRDSWPRALLQACIEVGLSCVEDDDAKRPAMSDVIQRISSTQRALPASLSASE